MKSIAVLFADGFEEIEAVSIVDTLRRAELEVVTAGVDDGVVTGAHGIGIEMDTLLEDLDDQQLDAVVLPGGMPGAANLRDSEEVLDCLRHMAAEEKLIGAICAAPIVLEAAGLLDDKRFTCYPGFEDQCGSGQHTGERVQVDGRVVTGAGPGAAIEFALELVGQLGKPAVADKLHQGMLVK